jgi:hypothetical protein
MGEDKDQDLAYLLPPALCEIADLIGLPAVKLLIEHYGGRRINIPAKKHITPGHVLAELIGHAAALKLSARFEGPEFYVPLAKNFKAAVRSRAIVAKHAEGLSAGNIATEFGMAEGSVYRILSQHKRRSAATFQPHPKNHHARS